MNNFRFLLFIGNSLKEFNSNESNGEAFIHIHGSELGLNYLVTLPIFVKNGEWVAESNDTVSFHEEDREVKIRAMGSGVLLKARVKGYYKSIYIMSVLLNDSYMKFKRYFLPEGIEVNIGSDRQNSIVYRNTGVSRLHARLYKKGNGIEFTCIKEGRTHLNGHSLKSGTFSVEFGDEINIIGLKIIILQGFIIMNNPEGKVICSCMPANTAALGEKAESEGDKSIYYTKTPRLTKHLNNDIVEIEPPPLPVQYKSQPLIHMLGPSMTMAFAMLASLGASIYLSGSGANPATIATSGIMAFSMLLGAVLWPVINRRYQKKVAAKEEGMRLEQYTSYVSQLSDELSKKAEWNREIMLDIHPEPKRIVNRFLNGSRKLWERTCQDDDFLDVRIGLGEQKNAVTINVAKEGFSISNDPLKKEAGKLKEKFKRISGMPVSIPIAKDVVIGVIGKWRERINIINCMLIQLAGLHSYDELKIIFICNETQMGEFQWVKHIPHIWSSDKSMRFFASCREETHEVLNYIDEIMREREEKNREGQQKKVALPCFAAFILDCSLVEEEASMRYLSDSKNGLSICSVFVGDSMGILPADCQTIIQHDDETCSLFNKSRKEEGQLPFNVDNLDIEDVQNFSGSISLYSLKSIGGDQSTPSAVDFLGMFRVGNVKQLDIGARWKESMPHKSLAAPIGVKAGGELFSLNIHEKYHGPHGLVAGMTGSGKSEFVQAYILSMAINFHPYDVSFILIDYKGGGMANCFKNLPHISGIITNLGGNQIRRSLISINAELKRRQRIFDAAGVKHIDEYQILYKEYLRRGQNSENKASIPLPHLVIISDEFAELKNQQPEFMEKLVSAARIGRSLGVHLILATQKPSGVVDDQIWSNSRFRVCLKVLDRQDSQEMLKRPEAAAIKLPGRAFVQVGYNEIFECIQSGYSGLKYMPEDEFIDPDTQRVVMIDNSAKPVKAASIKRNAQDSKKTQLEAVVDYINNYSETNSILPLRLWAEPLKEMMCLDEIPGFSNTGFDGTSWNSVEKWMCPVIGMVDDPESQSQYPLELEISKKGHIILYGMPGTGKTTFIQTLVFSIAKLYSPEDAIFYILDFGGRTLGYISELPHCLGVAFSDDENKVGKIFESIQKELESRKNKFALCYVGNIQAYKSTTGEKIPAVVVVLDSYSVFRERYGHLEDTFVSIAREGANYGIYLVITGSDKSAVYYKVTDYVKQFLTLQMTDKSSYMEILGQTNGLEPEPVKGRGLVKCHVPLEFQTALAAYEIDEAERTRKLKALSQNMKSAWSSLSRDNISDRRVSNPEKVKIESPKGDIKISTGSVEIVSLEETYNMENFYTALSDDFLPLAWNGRSHTAEGMDLRNPAGFYIGGFEKTGKTNMMKQTVKTIKMKQGSRAYVYESCGSSMKQFCSGCGVEGYMDEGQDFDAFLEGFIKEVNERVLDRRRYWESGGNPDGEYEYMSKYGKVFILIDGFEGFYKSISNKSVERLCKIFSIVLQNLNIYFITSENPEKLQQFATQEIYYRLIKTRFGILLGGMADRQAIFPFADMKPGEKSGILKAGQGYFYKDDAYSLVEVPQVL